MRRVAVVGASLAGLEAARELRRCGFDGELSILGDESRQPYDRPPLSKGLLGGSRSVESIGLPLDEACDAEWRLGVRAVRLDAKTRTLWLDDGTRSSYDGVVLATGAAASRPQLPANGPDPAAMAGVHVLRTLDDALSLADDLSASPGRVVIVGAGFIGAEVASTCREIGLDVTVVEGLAVPLEEVVGPVIGRAMAQLQRDHGVDLRLSRKLTGLTGGHRVEEVLLSDGTSIRADVVVLALGARPNSGWLDGSGLQVNQGVVCDEACIAAPGIVAAGDVARWPNRRYGVVRRVEHWDNAIRQAHHAASVLLTGPSPYRPVPWFWSDQFGRKLQMAGSPTRHDELRMVVGSAGDQRFLGLYRRGDRIVAAVCLNAAKSMLKCRELLERNSTWQDALDAFGGLREHLPRSSSAGSRP